MGFKLPSSATPAPPADYTKVLTCAEVYCAEAFKKWRLVNREYQVVIDRYTICL